MLEAAPWRPAEQVIVVRTIHALWMAAEVAVEGAVRPREQGEPAAVPVDIREAGCDSEEETASPAPRVIVIVEVSSAEGLDASGGWVHPSSLALRISVSCHV